jgi:hypothetical protein
MGRKLKHYVKLPFEERLMCLWGKMIKASFIAGNHQRLGFLGQSIFQTVKLPCIYEPFVWLGLSPTNTPIYILPLFEQKKNRQSTRFFLHA